MKGLKTIDGWIPAFSFLDQAQDWITKGISLYNLAAAVCCSIKNRKAEGDKRPDDQEQRPLASFLFW